MASEKSKKKVVKKTTPTKTTKKATTTKKAKVENNKTNSRGTLLKKENKLKSTRFTLILTIIGILACIGCVFIDTLREYYTNMPLYAILLFIIIVEDKK